MIRFSCIRIAIITCQIKTSVVVRDALKPFRRMIA